MASDERLRQQYNASVVHVAMTRAQLDAVEEHLGTRPRPSVVEKPGRDLSRYRTPASEDGWRADSSHPWDVNRIVRTRTGWAPAGPSDSDVAVIPPENLGMQLVNGELVTHYGVCPQVYEFDTCYPKDDIAVRPFGLVDYTLFSKHTAVAALRRVKPKPFVDCVAATAEWLAKSSPRWPKVDWRYGRPKAGMYIVNLEYECDRPQLTDIAVMPSPLSMPVQWVRPFAYGLGFLLLLWGCMAWEKWIGWVMR